MCVWLFFFFGGVVGGGGEEEGVDGKALPLPLSPPSPSFQACHPGPVEKESGMLLGREAPLEGRTLMTPRQGPSVLPEVCLSNREYCDWGVGAAAQHRPH